MEAVESDMAALDHSRRATRDELNAFDTEEAAMRERMNELNAIQPRKTALTADDDGWIEVGLARSPRGHPKSRHKAKSSGTPFKTKRFNL